MDREIKRKRFEIEEEIVNEGKRAKITGDADRDRGGEGPTAAEDPRHRDEGCSCDGEVEEFFAILRRIHVAVKYFERSKSRRGSMDGKKESPVKAETMVVAETPKVKGKDAAGATPWSPNFRREDFRGVDGNGDGYKRGAGTVGDNVWLDLNVKPDPVDE